MAPGDRGLIGQARADNLRRCVAHICSLDPLSQAVIHTGDMTQNDRPDEFAHAREIMAALPVPLYTTPGNRDGHDDAVPYAVDDHPVRLVAMDSLSDSHAMGDFSPRRLATLDAVLTAAPATATAIFLPHPPFPVESPVQPLQYVRPGAVDELAAVLGRHPHLVHMFCGHAHRLANAVVGGVPASTQPSVAIDLRKGEYPEAMAACPAYRIHRFEAGVDFTSELVFASP
jgi:3',5'-cyclic AMP phosphodiesterase CpdA